MTGLGAAPAVVGSEDPERNSSLYQPESYCRFTLVHVHQADKLRGEGSAAIGELARNQLP